MTIAGIKTKYIMLEPTVQEEVPNGAFFLNANASDSPTVKSTGGVPTQIGEVSDTSLFLKEMQAAGPIAAKAPVVKLSNGKITVSDSDGSGTQDIIGYAMEAAAAEDDLIDVLLVGANIAGALTGLGFTPGQQVYMSEAGGSGTPFTNDPNSFTGNDDSIIKLGIADCAAGVASSTATDLVIVTQIVLRP